MKHLILGIAVLVLLLALCLGAAWSLDRTAEQVCSLLEAAWSSETLDEAAGQRPGADEGMTAPTDEQHARAAVRMRKGGDVGRHRRAGIFARVVAGEEFGLSQAVFVSDSVSVFVSVSAHRSIHCFRFAEASFLPKCIENLCSGVRNAEAGNARATPALAGRRSANAAFDAAAPHCLRFG